MTDAATPEAMSSERVYEIAGKAHEMNRRWCELHGDDSQGPWSEAPGWQTKSAMNGVRAALAGATPAELHANWMLEKVDQGWNYGPEKDPENKSHPCIVAYAELPAEQRAKDSIFHAVVESMR